MNCTIYNTQIVSGAAYPGLDCYAVVDQFTKSARKFNYNIYFTQWRSNFEGWLKIKYIRILEELPKFKAQGIEYILWADASDSVFVKPFTEFINQAQQINLPEQSLLCAADWDTPYTIGIPNNEKPLVDVGYKSKDKPVAYCCLGLIFGHVDAWGTVGHKIEDLWKQNKNNPDQLAPQYELEKFNELTHKGFAHNCDQTMVHLLLKDNPLCVIPDIGQYLLSNYLGSDPNITLAQMRETKPKDQTHLSIHEAAVIHGSPVFRKGKPLENFINKL